MYHVIGTAVAVSVLYLISYIFYRIGIFSLGRHRKIWNSILAVTFIITALAGLFLALQINYKWNIPFIASVLKWHVETGAGFSLTAIFHLSWNISYFFSPRKKTVHRDIEGYSPVDSSLIAINLFVIGFISMSVQVLLLRELMNISGGYELNSGTFLASWLIASAAGAYAAGSSSLNDLRKINIVFAVSPAISVILLILLSRLFLEPGETPSFLVSMIFTFLVLIPFCLISGFTFMKLLAAAKYAGDFVPGKSFAIETLGGIVAGVVLTVLTAGMLNTYKLLLIILLLSFGFTLLTYFLDNKKIKLAFKIALALVSALIVIADPDILFKKMLLPGVEVTKTHDTPYGNITYGEYGDEKSIYYNHQLINYTDDVAEREENIHYAMLQVEDPQSIMIISGQMKSMISELEKYQLRNILFIERDPELIKVETRQIRSANINIKTENRDAFNYIRKDEGNYDAVLLLVPPPSTLSLNRYYTTEFFREVKARLESDGVFMCSPGIWDNYPNQESLLLFSSVWNSLNDVFAHVKPIVGNKLYLLASDTELSVSICELTKEKGIENIYVGSDFLADDLIMTKSEEVVALMDSEVRKNSIAFPVATFHFQTYFISQDLGEKIPALIILILLFILPLFTVNRNNMMMYFSAASLAGFEIIVLLSIQLAAGNMYQLTGAILAVFMTGLATGSGTESRIFAGLPIKIKMALIAIWYLAMAFIFEFLITSGSPIAVISIIVISIFPPSYLTGNIFRTLTVSDSGGLLSAKTYGADLAGSALGFILISGIVVPLIGIKTSAILLSGLIFTGILFGTKRNK